MLFVGKASHFGHPSMTDEGSGGC